MRMPLGLLVVLLLNASFATAIAAETEAVAACEGSPEIRLPCQIKLMHQWDAFIESQLGDLRAIAEHEGRPIPLGESQADWQRFRAKRCGDPQQLGSLPIDAALSAIACHLALVEERYLVLEDLITAYVPDE